MEEDLKQVDFNEVNSPKKVKKKGLLAGILLGVFVLLIAAFAVVFLVFRPQASAGNKHLTLTVVDNEAQEKCYKWDTDEEFLLPALMELKDFSIEGTDSEYGMMVESINGLRADYTKDNAYWAFYVNDAWCDYGVDQQPVQDMDVFRIEYTDASEGSY